MSNLLIVGGTGFIGYHVSLKACKQYKKIFILSSQNCPKNRFIPNAEYIQADINNYNQLKNALNNKHINYVINLSGYVNHKDFFNGGYSVIQTHLIGLFNLFKCIDIKCLKGFVQIGSSDEYGNTSSQSIESFRESPISPYSFAKTASMHFIQMLHRQNNLPVVGIRIFLTYGPNQSNQRFIPQIINGCLNDKKFPTSEGIQKRDFCHVYDISDGILKALISKQAYGKVINLSSGHAIKIKHVINLIKTIIGKGNPIYGEVPYRFNESMNLYGDISLAKEILKWKPQIELIDGLRETIEYYKERI